jgi:VWFA-related protein
VHSLIARLVSPGKMMIACEVSMSRISTIVLCLLSTIGLAQLGASQTQPNPTAEGQTTSTVDQSHWIHLDVVVTDKSGNPVPDLQQSDFTLLDDKQPKPILSFRAINETSKENAPPTQAIVLVDAVNSSFQLLGQQRMQLQQFLQRFGDQLPIPMSLVFLADTSAPVQLPTRDVKTLLAALNASPVGLRIIGNSQGVYGAIERAEICRRALQQLISYEKTQPGRKLLIWLSRGWPLLSGPGITLQQTDKDQEAIFKIVVDWSRELREARITLYSIDARGAGDIGGTFYYEEFVKGVRAAKQVQQGNLALQVLATQTGGRVVTLNNDIATAIAGCLQDAKAYYTIALESPPADHANEYHSLQVKIDRPKLTARTSTGYYAEPYKAAGR